MSPALLNTLVVLAILVGIAGIIVPVLPGVVLVAVALIAWAIVTGGTTAWVGVGLALAVILVGQVAKYLLPGRKMTAAGVPSRSIIVGGVAAVIGFFAIPVVGVVVGFLVGVLLAEQFRLRDLAAAWTSTWVAMKATGFSILIELASVLFGSAVWAATAVAV